MIYDIDENNPAMLAPRLNILARLRELCVFPFAFICESNPLKFKGYFRTNLLSHQLIAALIPVICLKNRLFLLKDASHG